MNYNKVKIIDNYDDTTYTIFYLNKKESFDKFEDAWNNMEEELEENDLSYDEIVYEFEEKNKNKFDFFELAQLDIYTDSEYELDI